MTLTSTDEDRLTRVCGNLAEFQRILDDPEAFFNASEWAGVLSCNVEELLNIIARLTEAETEVQPLHQWRPVRDFEGEPIVPSGTGWPVL